MNREQIRDIVFSVVNKHFNRNDCSEKTNLRNDWGATSIDDMELYLDLEDVLCFDDMGTGHIGLVGDLIDELYGIKNG